MNGPTGSMTISELTERLKLVIRSWAASDEADEDAYTYEKPEPLTLYKSELEEKSWK